MLLFFYTDANDIWKVTVFYMFRAVNRERPSRLLVTAPDGENGKSWDIPA